MLALRMSVVVPASPRTVTRARESASQPALKWAANRAQSQQGLMSQSVVMKMAMVAAAWRSRPNVPRQSQVAATDAPPPLSPTATAG
ncbi:MAG: hypothetical protein HG423_012725 [Propionibacterium sp.]|nr:hypothetical protein [Propionibacterium sp.]